MSGEKARLVFEFDGRVARVTLAAPKANIVDAGMVAKLEELFVQLSPRRNLAAIVLTAEGPHFSYGASVEEHLPGKIGPTLERFHGLLRQMLDLPALTIAGVRGQCLGGGLELALGCDLILAEESAQLGCPEIKLGVFPPAASALLPVRIGAGPAAELILTGLNWTGLEAARAGLVARTAPAGELDPVLREWLEKDFLPRSPSALRHATRATRRGSLRAMVKDLPDLERLYLLDLMAEPDAAEGISAFLEKRKPRWRNKEYVA